MYALMFRDEDRYGRFIAECEGIGKVTVEIEQCGFGEIISVCKDGNELAWIDTLEEDSETRYDETNDYLIIDEYRIRKPFEKKLRDGEGDACCDEDNYSCSSPFEDSTEDIMGQIIRKKTNKEQIVEALKELITNNSNLEAEEDDAVMFEGVTSVTVDNNEVVIRFGDREAVIKVEVKN